MASPLLGIFIEVNQKIRVLQTRCFWPAMKRWSHSAPAASQLFARMIGARPTARTCCRFSHGAQTTRRTNPQSDGYRTKDTQMQKEPAVICWLFLRFTYRQSSVQFACLRKKAGISIRSSDGEGVGSSSYWVMGGDIRRCAAPCPSEA